MKKLSNFISNHKKLIIIITFILLIPSIIGYKLTKINYDILVYLPEDIETMKGQEILTNDFGVGAYSFVIVENMQAKDLLNLEEQIKEIDHVGAAISYADVLGTTIPKEMLPKELINKISKDNVDVIAVTFDTSTSAEETLNAIEEIRDITDKNVLVGGMSSMVLDTKNVANSEILIYVTLAVLLCLIVLSLSLDSFVVPILLLANIGIAILFNMGTNIFLGNISYITKAISAVLQLGVTTDFSIFLYKRYQNAKKTNNTKEEAMSEAISDTFSSVTGSSLTTVAGFLALCTMQLTLGKDIGIVMAKGVVFGVLCVLIVFPALLLFFDNLIEKTKHKELNLKFNKIKSFSLRFPYLIFIIFLLLYYPFYYGNKNVDVYYDLDDSLPDTLESSIANEKLKKDFELVNTEMILVDSSIKNEEISKMINDIEKVDGINLVISANKLESMGFNSEMLPNKIQKMLYNDKYQLIIINSIYETASDELNEQVSTINGIIKKYDKNGIIAGVGPLTTDLVHICDEDFKNVNFTSIGVIFIIMLFVLKSISLPIILIITIEFAICINLGIPYYSVTELPFVASIVIGTIQLGATIDYAILLTNKYLSKRKTGTNKEESIKYALDNSIESIFVSGLCFFGATFGVGIYSKLSLISSLCNLMSRGAIISMLVVIIILPSLLYIFDGIITKTTLGFKGGLKNEKNN